MQMRKINTHMTRVNMTESGGERQHEWEHLCGCSTVEPGISYTDSPRCSGQCEEVDQQSLKLYLQSVFME